MADERWDFIIVGSGFGGSVSALRLVEKGYRVLLLEKGRRFAPEDFAKTNWDLKRWYWMPELGLKGIFKMSFMKHVTVLHGVGYGGGSLVYANTLPRPKDDFFQKDSWSSLADWSKELDPHYDTAERMLGAAENPKWTRADEVVAEIAKDLGREKDHHKTHVGVFFGEADKEVDDPYFQGEGPPRTGCTHCGACMVGCRVGAKNTLDKNYLYLAEKKGLEVRTEVEVTALRPLDGGGYAVDTKPSFGGVAKSTHEGAQVVLSGGVMGTIPLLMKMKEGPLPNLSPQLGHFVRTNSESLTGAVTPNHLKEDFSQGIAITSILHTSGNSHVEPVRYPAGSGFFRIAALPFASGSNAAVRLAKVLAGFARHPIKWLNTLLARDFARQSLIFLFMRTMEGSLDVALRRGWRTGFKRGLTTSLPTGQPSPDAFMPEATDLLHRLSEKVGGVPMGLVPETLLGVPTTAHILGGACMGATSADGVIDAQHRVHGYDGLYVVDGAAVSANPGVNPSLTITAMAERAMSFVPVKSEGLKSEGPKA